MKRDREKTEKRTVGERLKKDEVKTAIVEYILSNPSEVPQPQIASFLKKEYGLYDKTNIGKHLKQLSEEYNCIKIIKGERGFENQCDIKTVGNLKNIMFYFKDIKLNTYEKSINIILKKFGCVSTSFESLILYIRLRLSVTFFNMCIDTGIKKMCSTAWEIYLHEKDLNKNQLVKSNLNECYATFIKCHPNFEMSGDEFREAMNEMFFKVCDEKFPGWLSEMSTETYLKLIGELSVESHEILEEVLNMCEDKFTGWPIEMPRKLFLKSLESTKKSSTSMGSTFFELILWKMFEEKFPELPVDEILEMKKSLEMKFCEATVWKTDEEKFPGLTTDEILEMKTFSEILLCDETLWKMCEEKFPELPTEKFLEMKTFEKAIYNDLSMYTIIHATISSMKNQLIEFVVSRYDLIFKHCLHQDMFTSVASPEELEFGEKIEHNFEEYNSACREPNSSFSSKWSAYKKMILCDLKQASEIMTKYKQPSIFDDNYDNPEDIYQGLIEYYGYLLKRPALSLLI